MRLKGYYTKKQALKLFNEMQVIDNIEILQEKNEYSIFKNGKCIFDAMPSQCGYVIRVHDAWLDDICLETLTHKRINFK